MPFIIRPLATDTLPIEAEVLRPDALADKTLDHLRRSPVYHGNRQRPLGELFEADGDGSDGQLVLEGDFTRVKRVGENMVSGSITIRGDAGMHLGAEMRGGLIHVRGDAGHLVGGSYRGSRSGMKGGAILVGGNSGNEVGCGMRRGLIGVGGDVGDFPGFSLIAGTIVVCGAFGVRCGAGMRRGTIVALGGPDQRPELLSSFRHDCLYRPQFLAIYLRQLRTWGLPVDDEALGGQFQRYSGDLVALGKGEVLVWEREANGG